MSPLAFELPATISTLTLRDDAPTDDNSQYGYKPSEAIAILFITLYGISTSCDFFHSCNAQPVKLMGAFSPPVLHIGQATYYRMWWLLPTAVLCGIGKLLGWSGRLWSSISLAAQTPFLMQISTTIIAPTPLLAASFVIHFPIPPVHVVKTFQRVIQRLGTSYSRLTPKWYTILFLPCDIIALVIQGVGGGMASSANDLARANVGAHVMLGGIAFQFAVIILFSALTADFVHRSVYRIIELSGGWDGRIIQTEVYFNVLDGGMVVLALFTLNFAHPGLLLRQAPAKELVELQSRDSSPPPGKS
ncbi:RTA1-like protein [Mycena alexandri]|uniref:RTA1-like protein n=1 Tax=Mycena alexandri TaxID=1745969 RepID=A0AAD6SL15_9AGAR|nr:RTA1-like protein [Mycena alexandri]